MAEPYNWLSEKKYTTIELDKLFKYDSTIKSFQEQFERDSTADGMYIQNMVCNERYVYVLVEYQDNDYTLFVIDTTLPADDYKVYDVNVIAEESKKCKNCTDNPTHENYTSLESQLKDMKATQKPNKMQTIKIYNDTGLKLYTIQNSKDDQCVVISDNYIYLYKNGQVYKHEYMFTIKYINVYPNILYLCDEFNMVYMYTYSDDKCSTESRLDYTRCHYDFAHCDKTRVDIKGNRYRLTYMDTYPKYTLIDDVYPPKSYPKVCISKTLCAVESGTNGLTCLVQGLPPS